MRDEVELAAAANVQSAKKTIKPLKKSVRKRKVGGRKIAKK
jgi:hypothetical protein